jgi:hypothetical protein
MSRVADNASAVLYPPYTSPVVPHRECLLLFTCLLSAAADPHFEQATTTCISGVEYHGFEHGLERIRFGASASRV